jgi:hypothetical protein
LATSAEKMKTCERDETLIGRAFLQYFEIRHSGYLGVEHERRRWIAEPMMNSGIEQILWWC